MLRTFRAQLTISFFLVIVITPLIFIGLFYTAFGRYLRGGSGPAPVSQHARAIAGLVTDEMAGGHSDAEIAHLLRQAAFGTWYRFLFLDAQGRVLADTHPTAGIPSRRIVAAARSGAARDGSEIADWGPALIPIAAAGRPPRVFVALREHPNRSFFTLPGFAIRALVGLIIAGVVGLFLSRRLLRPVDQLTRAAEAMAAGDLSQRVAVPPHGELGHLAERFNTMATRVEELVTRVSAEHQSLLATHEELAQSERRQRELVANVSHELRNPLACIRASVEAILDGIADDEGRRERCLRAIEDEAASLSRLVNDLLTLSRIDSGDLPLRQDTVSVPQLVERCGNSFLARAESQGVALAWQCEGSPFFLGDAERITQVLGNVLDNALRHTGAGGRVSLEAGAAGAGAGAEIRVTDTGSGIPPEDLPHVFERLYRVEKSRSKHSGGAGLGLAITREIIEAHGGSIEINSVPGCGTTVRVWLPAPAEEQAPGPRALDEQTVSV